MAGRVICLSLALACAPRAAPPAEHNPGATTVGAVVSLERTPCFGSCPSYSVSVSASGLVAYEGRANVRRVGTDTARITPQQVQALLLELERAGYFTFADRYAPSEPTCRRPSTDSPSALSSATFRGRTKRIEHYYGCGGVPGALTVMERRIDEVLGSGRWTGR